jgi:small subunit ribosomal protein S8
MSGVTTDPIADLITRIRNANIVKHEVVELPSSKIKKAIVNILFSEGYLKDIEEYTDGVVPMLRLSMKYGKGKERTITGLKRISKPGLRVYCRKEETPKVLNGLGIAVISTSKGIVTDREARKLGLGGEVLCYVW